MVRPAESVETKYSLNRNTAGGLNNVSSVTYRPHLKILPSFLPSFLHSFIRILMGNFHSANVMQFQVPVSDPKRSEGRTMVLSACGVYLINLSNNCF